MKKVFRAVLAMSVLMASAITFAQDTKIDFDKNFNFAAVKTYSIQLGTKWRSKVSLIRFRPPVAAAAACASMTTE